jgi:hypothetical protein
MQDRPSVKEKNEKEFKLTEEQFKSSKSFLPKFKPSQLHKKISSRDLHHQMEREN